MKNCPSKMGSCSSKNISTGTVGVSSTLHPSHVPLVATIQSLFTSMKKELTDETVTYLEKIIGSGIQNFYTNFVDGKKVVLDGSISLSQGQIFGELLLVGAYYGFESPEYKNMYINGYKMSTDDVGYLEIGQEYIANFMTNFGKINYTEPADINKSQYHLGINFTSLILGDFGTGSPNGYALLDRVKKNFEITNIIHLGDTYYSGTKDEQKEHMIKPLSQYFDLETKENPNGKIKLSVIPGNHDYYSGGDGFRWLLDYIGQDYSCFTLSNEYFHIQGLDTAIISTNPLYPNTTSKMHPTEVKWAQSQLNSVIDTKGVVLLSHHPVITFNSTIEYEGQMDANSNTNKILYSMFKPYVPKLSSWMWGHLHLCQIYTDYTFNDDEKTTLHNPMLIGHGSSPPTEISNSQIYTPKTYDKNDTPVELNPQAKQVSIGSQFPNNGCAIMKGRLTDNIYSVTVYVYQLLSPQLGHFDDLDLLYTKCIFERTI